MKTVKPNKKCYESFQVTGKRPSSMIAFKRQGQRTSFGFSYNYLHHWELLNNNAELAITFGETVVIISGRNLEGLAEHLVLFTLIRVEEIKNECLKDFENDHVIVTSIEKMTAQLYQEECNLNQ